MRLSRSPSIYMPATLTFEIFPLCDYRERHDPTQWTVSHNTSIWILHCIFGLSLVYPLFVHDSTMKERPEEWMSNLTTAIPPELMEISRAAPDVCAYLSRPI